MKAKGGEPDGIFPREMDYLQGLSRVPQVFAGGGWDGGAEYTVLTRVSSRFISSPGVTVKESLAGL